MKRLLLASTAIFIFAASIFSNNVHAAAPDKAGDRQVTYALQASDINRVTVLISGGESPFAFYGDIYKNITYVPVASFSKSLGAMSTKRVGNTVSVSAKGLELTATAGDKYIKANEHYLHVPEMVTIIRGEVCVPVRTIATAFGAQVEWVQMISTVFITPGSTPISKESPYSDEDLYWMSRIITAEARGESFEGMIAVGNVIMNRIKSDSFPDTIYDVIFDRVTGVQFTPAYSGAIYTTPTEECIVAAKLALAGANVVDDCLYFAATTKCWAAGNRPYYGSIGGHYFYV